MYAGGYESASVRLGACCLEVARPEAAHLEAARLRFQVARLAASHIVPFHFAVFVFPQHNSLRPC